jgi:hypothetical protein
MGQEDIMLRMHRIGSLSYESWKPIGILVVHAWELIFVFGGWHHHDWLSMFTALYWCLGCLFICFRLGVFLAGLMVPCFILFRRFSCVICFCSVIPLLLFCLVALVLLPAFVRPCLAPWCGTSPPAWAVPSLGFLPCLVQVVYLSLWIVAKTER